jgi:hypothetical protein
MLLTAGSCPSGQTCAVVKDDGSTSCVVVGKAVAGEPCEGDGSSQTGGAGDPFHCAAGLTCLGAPGSRTCAALCHVDSPTDCPSGTTCTGSAQLFKDGNIGICQ